ncbi:MAG: helix-turn-helix domain-containing protein [Parasphingopyxis sp.]|uniref:helix-turn-helix domain-containing protein n=1 Tax=Parasphingopyxis sp. TaxID=1920299 RepID=UPI003FA0B9B4
MHSIAPLSTLTKPKTIKSFSGWRDAIQELFPGFDPKPHGGDPFEARISHWMVGDLDIADMHAGRCLVAHDRLHQRAAMRPGCCLILQMAGEAQVEQANHLVSLRPGDLTLVDGTRPVRFDFVQPYRQVSVRLGHGSVADRFGGSVPVGEILSGGDIMTEIIRGMIVSLSSGAMNLDAPKANLLVTNLLDLIGTAIPGLDGGRNGTDADDDGGSGAELLLVKYFIERNLSRPDLDPRTIAQGCGMSLRKLYRLFEDDGTTPNQWLIERRLLESRRLLKAPQNRSLSIGNVAMSTGFSSFSHFSRSYKQRFGLSPKEDRLSA